MTLSQSTFGDPISALFGKNGLFTNPVGAWDYFKNGRTNDVNQQIAEQNLQYQRERNEIEDERYAEETAYNRAFAEDERNYQRAFAEDERAYNRALQERLFEREDTAQIRQAEQLSSMGINPLSQQLNGAGAGQVVGSTVPGSSTSPTESSRGGTALNNQFQMKDQGMLPILSSMLSMVNTINGAKTGQYSRDSLALENDRKFLENLDYAHQLGIDYKGLIQKNGDTYLGDAKKGVTLDFTNKDGSLFDSDTWKNSGYTKYRKNRMESMPNWQYALDSFGNDDVYNQAEKALTKSAQLFDRVYENIPNKENYSKNPFRTLFNLFF